MTLRPALVIFLGLVVAAALIMTGARRLAAAESRRDSANTLLEQTRRDAAEIVALRARQQRAADSARPEDDVIAQINRILAELALPSRRHFTGLRAGSDAALPTSGSAGRAGPKYRRQTLRLSLHDLAPADLGAFLEGWRAAEPLWTPTEIELLHPRVKAAIANRYDVTITLSAVYVAES